MQNLIMYRTETSGKVNLRKSPSTPEYRQALIFPFTNTELTGLNSSKQLNIYIRDPSVILTYLIFLKMIQIFNTII